MQIHFSLDINECTDGTSGCHQNSTCHNTVGNFSCKCLIGFFGNGFVCHGKYLM